MNTQENGSNRLLEIGSCIERHWTWICTVQGDVDHDSNDGRRRDTRIDIR